MPEPRLPNARRPTIPQGVRDAVFARDGAACRYCGAPAAEADHVLAFAQGGSSEASNLVASCRTCNRLAGDRYFAEFAAKRDWLKRARNKLGPERLARIEAALIAGDTAGAMREMEHED